MKRFGKRKLTQLSMLPVAALFAIYGTLLLRNLGGVHAAAILCEGQPGTFTMLAPASVNPGQHFTLTKIAGFANTNIATVKSSTLTFTISGATPSSVSESWNGGPVHGDYEADYADMNLTASGAVGSTITVNLSEISAQVTIGTLNTTIDCSVSNGQLTANQPGQSFGLATIPIVAPVIDTGTGGGTAPAAPVASGSTSPTPAKSSTSTDTTMPSTTSGASGVNSSTNQKSTNIAANQTVAFSVRNYKNEPVANARIILDSSPPITTNSSGGAVLGDVIAGAHNISVASAGHTVSQVLHVIDTPIGDVLSVEIKLPQPPQTKRKAIIASSASTALVLAVAGSYIIRTRRAKNTLVRQTAAGSTSPATHSPLSFPAATPQSMTPQVIQPTTKPSDDQTPPENNPLA